MTDLDELERLLREATPRPWLVSVHTGDGTTIEPGDDWTIYGKDRASVVFEGGFSEHSAANAALIIALRNSAEGLIRDARRFRCALRHPETLLHWSGTDVEAALDSLIERGSDVHGH